MTAKQTASRCDKLQSSARVDVGEKSGGHLPLLGNCCRAIGLNLDDFLGVRIPAVPKDAKTSSYLRIPVDLPQCAAVGHNRGSHNTPHFMILVLLDDRCAGVV